MALFIKGPLAARPETAEKGAQFWDQNTNLTFTFDGDKWVCPLDEPEEVKAPVKEEVNEAVVTEETPAPKKKSTKKTKKEE